MKDSVCDKLCSPSHNRNSWSHLLAAATGVGERVACRGGGVRERQRERAGAEREKERRECHLLPVVNSK